MSSGFLGSLFSRFKKKDATKDKTPPAPKGQEQYKVTKQHNYDEVDLTQASTEPNWEVDKKPRNYDEIEIGANQSEQSKE